MSKYISRLAGSLAALALVGTVAAAAAEVPTQAQIEAATTAVQHEAIALSYDQEAAASESQANSHAKLAQTYRHAYSKSSPGAMASMASHCSRLEKNYHNAASEFRMMADEHRKMAAAAK